MKIIKAAIIVLTFSFFTSCDVLQDINKNGFPTGNLPLTQDEVVRGLKNALTVGTDTAVRRLSVTDGFLKDAAIKILLPPEAQNIMTHIGKIPGGQALLDKAIMSINRAAEDAATTAAPIFVDAVTSMSIQDAFGILRGNETAATLYLKDKTYVNLQNAFRPRISNSLSKPLVFNTSAEKLYQDLVSAYNVASLNGALFPKIAQNTLTDYATGKALDGLFLKISDEEKKIRSDASHRVTSILQRVFNKNNQ